MLERLLIPDIRELIDEGDFQCLAEVLNTWIPADVAALLSELTDDEQSKLLRLLKPERRIEVFELLGLDAQKRLLAELPTAETAELLNRMAPDDRTALLGELRPEEAERLLALLSTDERLVAESLLKQERDSVGRLMTPDYVAVQLDWTVKHVLDHVRTHGRDSETLNVIYVVDDEGKLIDDLRIREFLLAPLHSRVSDLADKHFVALHTTDRRRDAVEVFRKYDRSALPVVDARGKLVGIVTIDDVIDVAEEEATRELQQFGGLEALDEPYANTPLMSMVRKRDLAGVAVLG